jgi:hypothetical protein
VYWFISFYNDRIAKDPRFERLICTHKGTYADDCLVDRVTLVWFIFKYLLNIGQHMGLIRLFKLIKGFQTWQKIIFYCFFSLLSCLMILWKGKTVLNYCFDQIMKAKSKKMVKKKLASILRVWPSELFKSLSSIWGWSRWLKLISFDILRWNFCY